MDQLTALRACENGFYNALRLVLNAGIRSDSWPTANVDIDYQEQELPSDALHEAQSRRMSYEDGLSAPHKDLAKELGISDDEARKRVIENLEAYRYVRSALTPDEEPPAIEVIEAD